MQPRDRAGRATTTYVALVNNDATVAPGWLRAMVPVAESDERIGAVAAKMLFADRFHGIEFDVPDASHLVRGETRMLGVRVTGVRLDGERVDDRLAFDEGFHGAEPPLLRTGEEIARWSSADGALRIASDGTDVSTISVRLSCLEPRVVTLRSGDRRRRRSPSVTTPNGSTSRSRPSRST